MRTTVSVSAIGLLLAVIAAPASAQLVAGGNSTTRMERIPAPRELRLALTNAEQSRKDGDTAELAIALGALMEGLSRTDYLVERVVAEEPPAKPPAEPADKPAADPPPAANGQPANAKRPRVSMQGQVITLIERLTPPQREAFESLHGSKASGALDAAVSSGELASVEEVAHRWRHTEAGYEAALLLARRRLDQQRFDAAASWLVSLRDAKTARALFEPEISLLLVSAYWQRSEKAKALAVVAKVKRETPGLLDQMPPAWRDAFRAQRPGGALTSILGAPTEEVAAKLPSWPMFLGDASRAGRTTAAQLPAATLWRRDIVEDKQRAQQIETQQNNYMSAGTRAIPAIQPAIVGDRVIVRTPERLVSLHLADGQDVWSYPFNFRDDKPKTTTPAVRGNVIRIQAGLGGGVVMSPNGASFTKIWGNHLYGRICANDKYSYVIDGGFEMPSVREQQMMIFGARGIRVPGRTNNTVRKVHNRLTAINLNREGAVSWVVGGETGEMNPDLKGVFFLGAPLPHHGRLYVLYEQNEVVHLGVLDALTGATEWTLKLAPVMTGVSVDLNRRMLGVAPSLTDGVLICPTTVGGLIAVDVSQRRFLWGWAPATAAPPNRRAMIAQLQIRMAQSVSGATSPWFDSPVLVQDGRVLHCTDNNYLYCLDLRSGEPLWKRRRLDAWFLGCTNDKVALLVGQHRYTAISLQDGKAAWSESPFRAIPGGGAPTGRGFTDGDAYYMPVSEGLPGDSPELLRIDLASGDAKRTQLDRRLGNLAVVGNMIVSAGPEGVEALEMSGVAAADAVRQPGPTVDRDWESLSVQALIKLLDDPDFDVRETATLELGNRGAEAVPPLGKAAKTGSLESARRAALALVEMKRRGLEHPDLEGLLEEAARAKKGIREVLPSAASKRKRALALLLSFGARVLGDGATVRMDQGWRGKPKDLVHLKAIPTLSRLIISNTANADDMAKQINGLKRLRWLTLQNSGLTDEGVARLQDLPGLQHLDISQSEVTDASIEPLSRFKALRTLSIRKTKITETGREKLKKAMPVTNVTDPS